mgnify:CR=1 FL=1
MSKLLSAIEDETNVAFTENGALSNATTKSNVLNFFALGGAMRAREDSEIESMFSLALAEDELLALKTLFYLRDIRGGQGERRTFRVIINFLARVHPEVLRQNLDHIVEYGRWDDMLTLLDTPLEQEVLERFATQLGADLKSKTPSLLAKWLPSVNASSAATKRYAHKVMNHIEWTSKTYRKNLSHLRSLLDVVEKKTCANQWSEINYEHVPSRAGLMYSKAFSKHDATRYVKYLEDVKKGDKKINASTLYPYDIVEKCLEGNAPDNVDVLWNALPDYCADNPSTNGIVVADVSGSMHGRPMAVSVSLAMYFAERNEGLFKDSFITFSESPSIQKVQGHDIQAKVRNLEQTAWGFNTDLQAVFNLVLNTAVKNKMAKAEMPNVIYIISDMQFDQACSNNEKSNFAVVKDKYEGAGYKMPKLVFWNVNATANEVPVTKDEINTVLVSGCSPVIFKTVMSGTSPYKVMLSTLNQERYSVVTV